jgi:hypothetical protein
MGMLAGFIFLVLLVGLASGPLIWRLRQDRREARAEAIQADANRALFDALGGESFVAVRVQTPSFWGPGRVVLSTPSDWQWLLAPAWSAVLAHVPADYELVVRPVAAGPPLESDDLVLRRAA